MSPSDAFRKVPVGNLSVPALLGFVNFGAFAKHRCKLARRTGSLIALARRWRFRVAKNPNWVETFSLPVTA
jgi:hypothetical protein